MTDPTPTPTRAEVERFGCDQLGMDKMPDGEWVRFTDYKALRERAEAAEKERDISRKWEAHYHTAWGIACEKRWKATDRAVSLEAALQQVREAARVDGWNDAIEAAALKCRENSMSSMAGEKAIRALRRAAPTEGEA